MGGTNPRGGSNPSEEEGGDAPAPWRLCRAPASSPTLLGPAGFNLTNGGLPFTENHSACCRRVMPGPWPTATAGPTPAPPQASARPVSGRFLQPPQDALGPERPTPPRTFL